MTNDDGRELVTYRVDGPVVRFDPQAKMWSLTEMHRAAGGNPSKEPSRWLRGAQATELIAALEEQLAGSSNRRNSPICDGPDSEIASDLIETRRGNEGGTWAHWQIAAAYAHYLDPRFYLQWNEWAMAYATGCQPGAQVRGGALATADTLEARVAALEARAGSRRRPEGARVLLRRTVERIVEEVELRNVPVRPLTAAIRAVLAQAGRPLRPIEVTALLEAAGVPVAHATQVSGQLWHLAQRGDDVTRDEDGRYRLVDAA